MTLPWETWDVMYKKTKLGCRVLYLLVAHYYVKWFNGVRCQILGYWKVQSPWPMVCSQEIFARGKKWRSAEKRKMWMLVSPLLFIASVTLDKWVSCPVLNSLIYQINTWWITYSMSSSVVNKTDLFFVFTGFLFRGRDNYKHINKYIKIRILIFDKHLNFLNCKWNITILTFKNHGNDL